MNELIDFPCIAELHSLSLFPPLYYTYVRVTHYGAPELWRTSSCSPIMQPRLLEYFQLQIPRPLRPAAAELTFMKSSGATSSSRIFVHACVCISVPCRNIHSPLRNFLFGTTVDCFASGRNR